MKRFLVFLCLIVSSLLLVYGNVSAVTAYPTLSDKDMYAKTTDPLLGKGYNYTLIIREIRENDNTVTYKSCYSNVPFKLFIDTDGILKFVNEQYGYIMAFQGDYISGLAMPYNANGWTKEAWNSSVRIGYIVYSNTNIEVNGKVYYPNPPTVVSATLFDQNVDKDFFENLKDFYTNVPVLLACILVSVLTIIFLVTLLIWSINKVKGAF